jgi:hypothetical protein
MADSTFTSLACTPAAETDGEARGRAWGAELTCKLPNLNTSDLSALWQRESLFDEQGLLRVRGMIAEV